MEQDPRMKFPYDFLRRRVDLSWREVQYGLHRGWFGIEEVDVLAMDKIASVETPSVLLQKLGGERIDAERRELVDLLAREEPSQAEADMLRKWLYLALSWFYECRDQYPDPFENVECVYADFGYPVEIKSFVRCMPTAERGVANWKDLLYSRWKKYL